MSNPPEFPWDGHRIDNHEPPPHEYGPGRITPRTPVLGQWTEGRPAVQPPPPFLYQKPWVDPRFHGRPPMHHGKHRNKYFYVVLFLENYYPEKRYVDAAGQSQNYSSRKKEGQLKTWQITAGTKTSQAWWDEANDRLLHVRHGFSVPVTVQMWNADGQPVAYSPILRPDLNNVTVGQLFAVDAQELVVDFSHMPKPEQDEKFKLAVKSLPEMSLVADEENPNDKSLYDLVNVDRQQKGLAILFRRNSLDSLFDLIAEFDDAYWHSLDDSSVIKYLTQTSCYKQVSFTVKFSDDMQEALDLINPNYYQIKYSWEDPAVNKR